MAFSFKKFLAGIKLVPKTASTADSKGDLEVIDSTGKLGFHNGTTVSPVVTESHSAALTNKTIDADSNTITNIENADIKAAAAIDASKLADGSVSNTEFQYISTVTSNVQDQIDSKATATGLSDHINDTVDAHDASAISVSAISGLTATEVQAALAEHQVEIENVVSDLGAHILDTVDAHDASAISNVPSGNLAATDIQGAVDELQSDIDTRATSSALSAHTGASTGVHGVAGSVVGTSDTQTLTNKTVTGADIRTPVRSDVKQDTKANLVTYALTATNGQLVFATDTKEMFQVVDTLLEAVGGGAGIGGVDILFSQTFEEAAITDFTQTGLSLSTSSPIHGAISALMTHQAVANQSFKQVIAVDEKFRGQAMLLELNVKSTASAGNVTLNVYDETNAANIVASEQLTLSSATGGIKDFVAFTIPATCLSLSYTVTALPEAGSPVTRIDDIICQLNNAALLETSVTVPNITAWAGYTPVFQGFGTPSAVEMEWRQVGENVEVRGKFASGTSTAVEARVGLPNGYTSAGTGLIPSIQIVGMEVVGGSGNYFNTLIEPSVTYITFGSQVSGGTSGLTKQNGSVVIGTGGTVSFFASVPVLGLTATSDVAIPLTQSGIVQEADSYTVLSGNTGQVITVDVTNIPFASIISSTGTVGTWGGSSLTVLEDSVVSFSIQATFTAGLTRAISLFKNGTYVRNIGEYSSSTIHSGMFTGAFKKDDVISFRVTSNGGTLSNSTNHSLEITRQGSLKQVTVNTNSKITIPTSELRFEGASSRGAVATAIVKFDTMAKIRGDAFTVTNTANDGTYVTMTKAGKLDVSATLYSTVSGLYIGITKNQAILTATPVTSEILAGEFSAGNNDTFNVSWGGFVKIGDVIRISTNINTPTANGSNQFNLSFQEQDIQVSVSNTLPQFSESDSCVRLTGANGFGSTATTTRRFASVVQNLGTDIEYIDSATLGGQFIAKASGIYNVSFTENSTANQRDSGVFIRVNGTAVAYDNQIYNTATIDNKIASASWSGYLTSGDIVTGTAVSTNNGIDALFTMSKVGKPNVTGVDVTPFVITQFDKGSIGEIKAFAGNVDAMHYLECDGRAVSRGTYSDLFAAIGITHGQGDGSLTFNIPDYRGRFLRGTSGAATLDPDKLTRTAMNTGGNTGNLVGSVQADAFASHNHSFSKNTNLAQGNGGAFTTGTLGDTLSRTLNDATGGNETRPENAYVNYGIRFKAANEAILTETDTFSTDTAALTYAGSGTYTLSTLANAPVGTFITFTYAINTNTRTQTTTAPTQTTADMNANGMLIYTRAYNAASTAAQPAAIAVQIGKGLKGLSTSIYKSSGKSISGEMQGIPYAATADAGFYSNSYNEVTGILYVDAGITWTSSVTAHLINYSDLTSTTNGYLVINASKNPALTGLGLGTVAARAVCSSGQSIPNNVATSIVWDAVKTFDTHGAFNAATGVFTAPETGHYVVSGNLFFTAAAYTANEVAQIWIQKNGVTVAFGELRVATSSTLITNPKISDIVKANKGDTIEVKAFHNLGAGAVTLIADPTGNFVSIAKAGV